ncbi:acyl-CoA dehydrogenase family protein [Sapientia aquatica]|uniref:Acyl-CoA dehydrogenase n=1 Tax=Sapientia aquatica TaxID=1549640 RepID=A0A4R5W126_9BURK|nr:acyl-CoA dehydrogenase family protein [Sapientia aquatica]TDK65652.1 acyl-CoA dehydrogenase [Sapientia aquatica]
MALPRTIFDSDHELFRDSARKFFQHEIGPNARRWREQGYCDRDAYRKAGKQGYLLMWADEELGGLELHDLRYEQILIEENARFGDSSLYLNLHSMVVAPYINQLGSAEQRKKYLIPAATGESILAIAMTEPGAGSDLAGMRTRAEDNGDHWLLNGSKTYISNGIQSDVVVVAARTVPDQPYGIGLFIIEAGMQGFERGRKLKKMGLHAQDTSELFFDQLKVPKENVLGDPTKGFSYLTDFLGLERLQIAIAAIAEAQIAFDLTLEFVQQRTAFGRPIGTLQNTRFQLAEMRSQIDAVQCFIDQCVMLGNDAKLTADVAAEAKLVATELQGVVLDKCVQLHGGAGFMEEYQISRMYTDGRVSRIFGGTSEIMKEIIGRSLGLGERKLA